MRTFRPAACASLAALVCTSRMLGAQPAGEPVRLEVHAPPACTDTDRFFSRVHAETSRARIANPTELARTFAIEIEERGEGAWGRLTIRDPSGTVTERELIARTCQEAVEGLAFVVALAVDPTITPQVPNPPPSAAPPPPSPPAVPVPRRLTGSVGIEGQAVGAVAPQALWGAGVSVVLSSSGTNIVSPSLRIIASGALHSGFATSWGTAKISYVGGAVEVCPLRFALVDPLALRPCVEAGVGFVFASGADAPNPQDSRRGWGDIGGGLRLEWTPTALIRFGLGGNVIIPTRQDKYLFGPNVFYEVEPYGFAGNLGADFRFF